MSLPQKPKPAKLLIGIFVKDKDLVKDISQDLIDHFGPIDLISAWLPFDYTNYYQKEMGKPLVRRVFSFIELIEQTFLAEVKNITNDIEEKYSQNCSRRVNIDPGYLLLERFVLATGKNFAHRIYIGKKIYADLTLIYKDGRYHTLPWTYPDYAAENMMKYLLKVRSKYANDLKQILSNTQEEKTDGNDMPK
jgi:hypothetical protein